MACLPASMRAQTKQHVQRPPLNIPSRCSEGGCGEPGKHSGDAGSGSQIAVPHGRRCATARGDPELPE